MSHRIVHSIQKTAVGWSAIIVITLIALGLRLYRFDTFSLWIDEMYTLRDALIRDKPQLTFTLTRLFTSQYGVSEWSLRLPSLLIGTITIPITWALLRKMFDPLVAIIAAAILAVSPWHIYWSQNARFYISIFLFYNLALVTFYWATEDGKVRWGWLALSTLLLGVAVADRITALVFVPVAVAWLLIGPILRPSFHWKPVQLQKIGLFAAISFGIIAPLHTTQFSGFFSYFVGASNYHPIMLVGRIAAWIGIPLFITGVATTGYLAVKRSPAETIALLAAWVPLVALSVIATFTMTFPRYGFMVLFGWAILGAIAVRELIHRLPGRGQWLAIGVLAILLIEPLIQYANYQAADGFRPNWQAAYAEIDAQSPTPQDLIIAPWPEIGRFYTPLPHIEWPTDVTPDQVEQYGRTWLVEGMWTFTGEWRDYADTHCRVTGIYDQQRLIQLIQMRVYSCTPD